MRQCTRCGAGLDEGEQFCGSCGAKVAPASSARASSAAPFLLLGCVLLLLALGAVGVGAWWWTRTRAPGPTVAASPAPSPEASGALEELAGAWTVDRTDPEFDPEHPDDARAEFVARDGILVATSPQDPGVQVRLLERRGEEIRGEYVDADGTRTPFTARYRDDRLIVSIDGETGTLVRAGAEGPPARPEVVLFEDRGDLDGDGSTETVVVVDEDGTTDPVTASGRHLEVRSADGAVAFRTESWQVPFRPDLDHLADRPDNRAGVHVVPGSGRYPDIRLVFVPASEDFVVYRFDGSTYGMAPRGQ